jgi:integrase
LPAAVTTYLALLGETKLARLDGEILDSFDAANRRCRLRCGGRKFIEHRTDRAHDCDHRCGPHVCKPLGNSGRRQIYFILSGALKRAMRWKWITVNPIDQAEPPPGIVSNPNPPSPAEAARLVNEAWKEPEWGTFVWLAMTSGARRAELCGLHWEDLLFDTGVIWLRRALYKDEKGVLKEKDLKTISNAASPWTPRR